MKAPTKKLVFLLDPGHGGVINGVPQTAGKRSPDWEKGILYEGVSNRDLAQRIKSKCEKAGIWAVILVPELIDISLKERVKRANAYKNAIFLSLHSDAFNNESANGWSSYTYYGQTDSDKVATILYKHAKKAKLNLRQDNSDGDPDKEANFYVLRKTTMPAVLVESLFMTNKADYNTLNSEKGREKLANVVFNTIKEISLNGLK
jgi:N-acetylmuramoyl-L-alanine amidase